MTQMMVLMASQPQSQKAKAAAKKAAANSVDDSSDEASPGAKGEGEDILAQALIHGQQVHHRENHH
jgi:microcystin degradation protein MlrC